jgi:FkbM family methyltransferase
VRRIVTSLFGIMLVALLAGSCRGRSPLPAESPAAAPPVASGVTIVCPTRGPFNESSGYFGQFYEDYILAYVFKDMKRGLYVDVGASDPDANSVTKYFYTSGWRGISIDANPEILTLLEKSRPEDTNLGIGISDTPGELTFYRFTRFSGLSTFDPQIAARHKAAGVDYETIKVPVTTLNEVLDRPKSPKQEISFLNVDVEGFEKRVFTGIDFARHPVQVIMAESTAPETEAPTYQAWEPILVKGGFLFAMDDGLNRYYVHRTHRELLPRFLEASYCVGSDKVAKDLKLNGYMPAR